MTHDLHHYSTLTTMVHIIIGIMRLGHFIECLSTQEFRQHLSSNPILSSIPERWGVWSFLHISNHIYLKKTIPPTKLVDNFFPNRSFPVKKMEEFATEEDGSERPDVEYIVFSFMGKIVTSLILLTVSIKF